MSANMHFMRVRIVCNHVHECMYHQELMHFSSMCIIIMNNIILVFLFSPIQALP